MRQKIILAVLWYLRFLARIALARHRPIIIGIAGSVGKSSCTNAIFAILNDHYPTKMVGNSETGIPLGILGIKPTDYSKLDWLIMLARAPFGINYLKNAKYLLAEMGIDDPYPPKNMGYLLTILKPHIAIVLNESATHSLQFEKSLPTHFKKSELKNSSTIETGKSREEKLDVNVSSQSDETRLQLIIQKIAEEDCKIITSSDCQIGIYNADDKNIVYALKKSSLSHSTILHTFGKVKSNTLSYKDYTVTLEQTSFSFASEIKQYGNITINLKGFALPQAYQQTIAAAILAAFQTNLTAEQIKASLEKNFTLPKGRASLLRGINNSVIIDSSYNASRASVLAFLDLVEKLKKQTKRPAVFLFGDMRELGKQAKIEHEAVAQKLNGIIDYLYCVGPLTKEFVMPIYSLDSQMHKLKEIRWFLNFRVAGEFLKNHLPRNSIVLVKGSQNTIFLEEAIKYILADKKDVSNLCRQSKFWLRVKNIY
jgi:UDP-N-acetylmuramoyl-tripeptide--D-alanyl-D-alanine ligase